MEEMERIIGAGLAELGFDPVKAIPLTRYGELLLEKNRVMNLTGLDTPAEVASLHMLDCAALCARWPISGRVIDVGTGAGFPGMVIAILCPGAEVTLLDPLQKRLDFLAEVVAALGLSNVTLLHGRGEELGRTDGLREGFDFAAARAVASLTVLSELCLPFVRPGGWFLPMKAVDSLAEFQAAETTIRTLGGQSEAPVDYPVYGTDVVHRVYPIRKVGPTPGGYPRRWAKIARGEG